jgi:hypothetical protein
LVLQSIHLRRQPLEESIIQPWHTPKHQLELLNMAQEDRKEEIAYFADLRKSGIAKKEIVELMEIVNSNSTACATTWFKLTKNKQPSKEEFRKKVVEFMEHFNHTTS